MGLEANCRCRWDDGLGETKALLEADALILRGDLKRRIPIGEISDLSASGAELHFRHFTETFALELGAARAARWAEKIAAPPPSLAKKLGVAAGSKVLVVGMLEDAVLQEALKGAIAARDEEAALSLAVIRDEAALRRALSRHEFLAAGTPIWIVHEKGPKAAFGEGPVRSIMRGAGYLDNKVSAVSEALSATRYVRVGGAKSLAD